MGSTKQKRTPVCRCAHLAVTCSGRGCGVFFPREVGGADSEECWQGPLMKVAARLSKSKLQEISDCFYEFSDAKGFLDKDDLKVAVTALLGFRPSKYDVHQMLAAAAAEDPNCPGISQELFVESMSRRLALVDPDEEVRQMFKAFDRGCRGFITRDDLRQVISDTFSEEDMPPAKVAEMFSEADWDGSGRIGYQQFEGMVKNRLPAELMRRKQRRQPF